MTKFFLFVLLVCALSLAAQDTNSSDLAEKDAEIARLKDQNDQQKQKIEDLEAQVKALQTPIEHGGGNRDGTGTAFTARDTSPPLDFALILSIATPGVVVVGSVLVWFLMIVPRRRRKPLVDALAILTRDDPKTFSEIERLLGRALTAGLRQADIAESRFALAYVRARLSRYAEAETGLADIEAGGELNGESAYLKLWLLARQKKHDEVESFYSRAAKLLANVIDAKRIASISFLYLGRKNLALRSTAVALDYFDRVRALDVLADQVPADLADHHLVFGLNSAFENKWPEARKHFEAGANSGKDDSPNARLGVLLCDWRETPSTDVDEKLSALLPAVEAIYAKGAKTRAARAKNSGNSNDKEKPPEDANPDEATLLLASCRLWHVFSLLRRWTLRSGGTQVPKEDLDALATRSAAVKEVAPTMPEPWLVEGLIAYYFAGGDPKARANAVQNIEKASEFEMSVPEVLLLLRHEREQQRLLDDGTQTYMKLLRSYLSNQEIPESFRRKVREQVARFERYKSFEEIEITEGDRDVAPSLADLRARVEIIHKRINELVRPRLSGDSNQAAKKELDTVTEDIRTTAEVLREKAAHLESAEAKITVYAAEILLAEESPVTERLLSEGTPVTQILHPEATELSRSRKTQVTAKEN